MKTETLSDYRIPAGLYGRLADELTVNRYVENAKAKARTIERDDEAGTIRVTKGETLTFSAIRKGDPGQPWILMLNPTFYPKPQIFRNHSVTVHHHPETREQFAVIDGRQVVPFDICRIAAGSDRWMREIVFHCIDCKGDVKAGESECQLCPSCYEKAEQENAELNE